MLENGAVVETTTRPDGSTGTTVVDPEGKVEAEVSLSEKAIEEAEKTEKPVVLPIAAVSAERESEAAPVVIVHTGSDAPMYVEVPVEKVTPGTVAVLVLADGTEQVVKNSIPTENGVALSVPDGATMKIMDLSKNYHDVHEEKHWGGEAIDFASARGVMIGTGNGAFSPDETTTRGMVLTALARYDGHDTKPEKGEHWQTPGVEWAVESGVSDGEDPDGFVTREQIVTMLWRYAGSPAPSGDLDSYIGADELSDWAEKAMRWAVETGIIKGRGEKNIAPRANATRAEFVQMLYRFCKGDQTI